MDKINIVDSEGNNKEVYLVTIVSLDEFNSNYLVYCENEIVDGKNEISIAKMNEENGELYLDNITTNEEIFAIQKELSKELSE